MNIALIGGAGAGKTSTKNHLVKQGFSGISLASPMKMLESAMRDDLHVAVRIAEELAVRYHRVCTHCSWPTLTEDQLIEYLDICKETSLMPVEDSDKQRLRLQHLGTEVRRRVTDMFWIRLLHEQTMGHEGREYVCDDVRFPNELQFFAERKWLAIGLKVSPDVQRQRLTDRDGGYNEAAFRHASETEIQNLLADPEVKPVDADLPLAEMLAEVDKIVEKHTCEQSF